MESLNNKGIENNENNKKNSKSLKEKLILYIDDKGYKVDDLIKGYVEMASINLEISQISCTYDLEECVKYESWLSESDMSDDKYDSEKRRYLLCRS